MRVTSELWVHAYLRRVAAAGGFAVVARKGAIEAGSIFIRVDCGDRLSLLFVPAPQSAYDEGSGERRWSPLWSGAAMPASDVDERLTREIGFDSDIWIVGVEDRDGRHFLGDLLTS